MNVIGLDVGFAVHRPTSGVAHLGPAGLRLGHATAAWADRQRALGTVEDADVTAIDAPIVPDIEHGHRAVERLLCGGSFQRRCKPGASHVPGTGAQLRQAGRATAEQLAAITSSRVMRREFPRVWPAHNVVEAFPNAFLGVCIAETTYRAMPKLKRGRKFDWLYDHWCHDDLFATLADALGIADAAIADNCRRNTHHEERAALVCLLTAASVVNGTYVATGDAQGGYIFLPPWAFWAPWARHELDRQRRRFPQATVWIDGASFAPTDVLPTPR
jgi:hypothetical protein